MERQTSEELQLQPEATLQAFGPLWTETGGLIFLSLSFTLCENGLILARTIDAYSMPSEKPTLASGGD